MSMASSLWRPQHTALAPDGSPQQAFCDYEYYWWALFDVTHTISSEAIATSNEDVRRKYSLANSKRTLDTYPPSDDIVAIDAQKQIDTFSLETKPTTAQVQHPHGSTTKSGHYHYSHEPRIPNQSYAMFADEMHSY
jgi:hypothetical protein